MNKIGVIGGSGIYNIDGIQFVAKHDIETPFGKPSSEILELSIEENTFYFLPRHGVGHKISPSEINYRANIFALKKMGVDTVISVSAVGSLKEEYAPTDFVLPSQFIDWTKGLRPRTFFSNGVVGHVSNAYPVHSELQSHLNDSLKKINVNHHIGGSYICIEGPQFSTRAESELFRSFGADVIGMTNVPEAFLAKEAGIAYATVAMVTDYDCWKEEHCTVEEIMKVMGKNYESAKLLIKDIIPRLFSNPITVNAENKYAVVTNPELISAEQKEINTVLLS